MKHNDHPIVVVKRKKVKKHEGSHGSWKIAYADFMTAMMAFFMVMWLISISNPKQLMQIADYFKMPLKVALTGGARNSDSESPIPGGGQDPTDKSGEVRKEPNIDEQKRALEARRLASLRERLDQLIEADPRLRALRPHLLINLVEQGLRIQIIDSQNRPMFKTGSAEVEPYMRDILRAIAPVLNSIPNRISLAGHTDDYPYVSGERLYSNWELSTDRANASRRELVAGGLDDDKMLRIVGMAATMKLKNRSGDDAVNRRISLLVLNHDTEQQIERENGESDSAPLSELDNLKSVNAPQQPGTSATGSATASQAADTGVNASAPQPAGSGQQKAVSAVSTVAPVPARVTAESTTASTQAAGMAAKVTPTAAASAESQTQSLHRQVTRVKSDGTTTTVVTLSATSAVQDNQSPADEPASSAVPVKLLSAVPAAQAGSD